VRRYFRLYKPLSLATLTIQQRLTWSMVSLITITVLVASWVTVRNASDQEEQKLFRQASQDVSVITAYFDGTGRVLRAQAELMADSPTVHLGVAAGNETGLAAFLQPRAADLGADTVEVIAANGKAILPPPGPVQAPTNMTTFSTVRLALNGSSAVGLEHDDTQPRTAGWALRAAAPIFDGNQTVAALILSRRVDQSLAMQLAGFASSDATVSITSGTLIIAATQRDSEGKLVTGRELPLPMFDSATRGGKAVERGEVFGIDAVYALAPYMGPGGQPGGYVLVVEPVTLAQSVVRASVPRIAQAFLGVLLLGVLVSWLIGMTISRPIRRLSRAASRIARGDMAAPIYPEGADEVAALARVMERMRHGLELLFEGSRTLATSLDVQEVLSTICPLAMRALRGNRSFVVLRGKGDRTIEGACATGLEVDRLRHDAMRILADPFIVTAIRSRTPVIVQDTQDGGAQKSVLAEDLGIRSALILPLAHGETVLGVLVVGHSLLPRRFTADQLPLTEALCQQAVVAIEHARQHRKAQEETRYRESIMSTMPIAVCTLDGQGRFEYVNEAALTQLGYTNDELLGRHFAIGFPKEEHQEANAQWEQLKRTGDTMFTSVVQRKNGERRTVSIHLGTIVPGQRYVAIAQDITDRERLLDEIQRRNKELATLYNVADTVSASLDVNAVLQRALTLVLDTMQADAGRIYLLERGGTYLVLSAQVGEADRVQQGLGRVHLGERLTGSVAQHAEPIVVDDIQVDPRAAQQAKDEGIRSYAGIPLMAKHEVVGVMSVESYRLRPFSNAEVELLMTIGQQIAVAIENGWLYERARELAVAEERNRLAREIHDTIAQGLTGITLQLEFAKSVLHEEPDTALTSIEKAQALSRSSLEEARRSVMDLRAAPLQELTLPEALERLSQQVERDSGICVRFCHEAGRPIGRLPARIEAALYRITQEALTNVTRHADAHRVEVTLRYDEAELRLVVQDDGKGFDPDLRPGLDEQGGFGLVGIRERARLLGGAAEVSSAPGMGTRVQVVLPDTWSRYTELSHVAGAEQA
jgi:two-component system NarL family sensor kinase